MPRTQRLIINDESTVYHVMSRTALDGFPLGDDERIFAGGLVPSLREKLSSLSEYMREIKVGFARFYNRRGYFWGDRFKSVIVENGETLINCLVYIDLNPLRAGLVERPEQYRWNSLGYHVQTNNRHNFLSTDFSLKEFNAKSKKSALEGIVDMSMKQER